MGRTNTAIWEEIKSEHTICLCYSESKGLYVSSIYFAPKEEILFLPHGDKGFWEREVQVPKDNLSIKIKTNFGYGSMTYMKAIVEPILYEWKGISVIKVPSSDDTPDSMAKCCWLHLFPLPYASD